MLKQHTAIGIWLTFSSVSSGLPFGHLASERLKLKLKSKALGHLGFPWGLASDQVGILP